MIYLCQLSGEKKHFLLARDAEVQEHQDELQEVDAEIYASELPSSSDPYMLVQLEILLETLFDFTRIPNFPLAIIKRSTWDILKA